MASWSERKPAREELWRILRDLPGRYEGKQIHGIVDPMAAISFLDRGGAEATFVDGYLIVWSATSPWYSFDTVLHELLVVRVEPGGTLSSVAHFLRHKAREAGAKFIAVGTAFAKNDRALARLYEAQGFTAEAILLTAET